MALKSITQLKKLFKMKITKMNKAQMDLKLSHRLTLRKNKQVKETEENADIGRQKTMLMITFIIEFLNNL